MTMLLYIVGWYKNSLKRPETIIRRHKPRNDRKYNDHQKQGGKTNSGLETQHIILKSEQNEPYSKTRVDPDLWENSCKTLQSTNQVLSKVSSSCSILYGQCICCEWTSRWWLFPCSFSVNVLLPILCLSYVMDCSITALLGLNGTILSIVPMLTRAR